MAQDTKHEGRRLALVTGASTGIGRELGTVFAREGWDLVLVAEDPDVERAARELSALGTTCEAIVADLATREGVESVAARFGADRRAPDAVALNAGIGLGGAFLDQELERVFEVIALNVTGTVHLAHRILPAMVSRGEGRVLFTSSIAARLPGSYQAVYNATKAFVQSFAEALRNELKDSGVTVTALQPGATETEFFHRAGMDNTQVGQQDKADPQDVARQGYEAMLAGKDHVVAATLKERVLAAAALVMPEPLKAEQHRKMAEPGSGSH